MRARAVSASPRRSAGPKWSLSHRRIRGSHIDLKELFGGWVYFYTYAEKNGRPARSYYYWKCTGPTARKFLEDIYGFLSPRRRGQIDVALARDRKAA